MLKTTLPQNNTLLASSFRDPSGFLFRRDGVLYRQVNKRYAEDFALLVSSGLYDRLVKSGLLVSHQEVHIKPEQPDQADRVLEPQVVPFISYPYEWSFSEYKDAALATLKIQKRALKSGMSLKDASAYNIQFVDGRPLLIDTLSFETYHEGAPWVAYRQFCQHFLAPLALMAYRDVRLGQWMRVYIDGIPLDLASSLLPARTRLNFGLLTHIHLHAQAQRSFADKAVGQPGKVTGMSRQAMVGLIESLEAAIKRLEWKPAGTEWGNYYDITNYSDAAFEQKKEIISAWVEKLQPACVWDLGANNGFFSRLASEKGITTVAFDIDPAAVEINYRQIKAGKEKNLLPLVLDLTNPSPDLGWNLGERDSLLGRGPAGMVMSLALIHHLAISNNVPLERVAGFMAGLGKWLVIEFVPKADSQVKKLLQSREDIFPDYTRDGFEKAFGRYYTIRETVSIAESERLLYLMESRD